MAKFDINDVNNRDVMPETQHFNAPAAADAEPIKGLSVDEVQDPNKIQVTIQNRQVPIVVLFGPPTCGKTMTLIRLSNWLINHGYSVRPETSFRPHDDKFFERMCDEFPDMISTMTAADSTPQISFMLAEVSKNGYPVCQILEAPGEHFFDLDRPLRPVPTYINAIVSSLSNPKIWCVFLEPNQTNRKMTVQKQQQYVQRIREFRSKMQRRDKVIMVYNKVDADYELTPRLGEVNRGATLNKARISYPNLFELFRNENPITKMWRSYNCEFVPYSNGSFNEVEEGNAVYTPGPDIYPALLWRSILRYIKG